MAGRGGAGRLPGLVCLDEPTRGMDRARKDELGGWLGELAGRGRRRCWSRPTTSSSRPRSPSGWSCSGDGELIADGPVDEILSGGWYFATEVARILGLGGAISPERGAELLRGPGSTVDAEAVR